MQCDRLFRLQDALEEAYPGLYRKGNPDDCEITVSESFLENTLYRISFS
jgi:hypothetical protein